MTHADLVERAVRWLRGTMGCKLVLREMTGWGGEQADAIGWNRNTSVLVECKATRSDFLADAKKPWRQPIAGVGMGVIRYYLTPPGLVRESELPEDWGLIEARPSMIRNLRLGQPRKADHAAEVSALLSVVSRLSNPGFNRGPIAHLAWEPPVEVSPPAPGAETDG